MKKECLSHFSAEDWPMKPMQGLHLLSSAPVPNKMGLLFQTQQGESGIALLIHLTAAQEVSSAIIAVLKCL